MKKFSVITLCGSSKFKKEFIEAEKQLTRQGYIVITTHLFKHHGDEVTEEEEEMLYRMYKQSIAMSDEGIYVINKGGYIGETTREEIKLANSLGLPVSYMEYGK